MSRAALASLCWMQGRRGVSRAGVDHPHSLVRTISDRQLSDWKGWMRRSRDRVGETPEYLIRTGSMKSRDIKEEEEDRERPSITLPDSNYASYYLQTGCFMWTGR